MRGDAKAAFDYFTSSSGGGWSPAQAAAIVGNLQYESGLDTRKVGDNGSAIGLAQWHFPRQQKFLQVMGTPVEQATFGEQLKFVNYELTNGDYKSAGADLRSRKTVVDATKSFGQNYEAPANLGSSLAQRTQIAAGLANSYSPNDGMFGISGPVWDAIKNGAQIAGESLGPIGAIVGMGAGALTGAGDQIANVGTVAVNGIKSFDPTTWFHDHIIAIAKDYGIPILLVGGAIFIIFGSTWGLVKDGPVGQAIKTGSKVAAL